MEAKSLYLEILTKKTAVLSRYQILFFKEILVIWLEVNFEQTVTSDEHFLASPLRYKSLIKIENKPVF